MPFLNLDIGVLGYEDTPVTSAPLLQIPNWTRSLRGLAVDKLGAPQVASIPPGGSATIINGSRTLTVDGTTAFSLTLDPLDPTQYFLTWTGGTAPGFRTDRSLVMTGNTLSVTPQANGSVLLSITNLVMGSFAGVSPGDNLWIPGMSTGSTPGPFNPLNEGLWIVLSIVDSQDIILVRPTGSTLGYAAQVGVVITNALQVQAFSAAGVQVDDQLDLSAGVASPSALLSTFDVTGVTAQQLTIRSTNPLPLVTGYIPTAAGINVYSQAFNFLYLEADQACAVQCNGDTGQGVRVTPWVAPGCCSPSGKVNAAGVPSSFLKVGPTWSLVVVNRSTNALNLTILSAQ